VSPTKSWRRLTQVESGRLRGAFPYEDGLVLATWAYCPNDPSTRGQMAAFLVRAFNLP